MAEGLKANATLTNLSLMTNRIADEGAKAWCLVRMVRKKGIARSKIQAIESEVSEMLKGSERVAECIFTCFSCYLQNEIKKDVNNRWGDCQKEILHKVISGVTLSICLFQGHMQMSGDSDSSLVVLWWSDWLGCVWMFIWQIKMSLEGYF